METQGNKKPSPADLDLLRDLVRGAQKKAPAIRAGELVAAAEHITGIVDKETGESLMGGLLSLPAAVKVLEEIRSQLEETLRSPLDWEEKEEQKKSLKKIADRIEKNEKLADASKREDYRIRREAK